jgi:hypothetical protein
MITKLYGSHPDGWTGKQIQVYATEVKAFGATTDALRIRDFVPKIEVDIMGSIAKLQTSKTLTELKNIWTKLPVSARNNTVLIKSKDEIKATLS